MKFKSVHTYIIISKTQIYLSISVLTSYNLKSHIWPHIIWSNLHVLQGAVGIVLRVVAGRHWAVHSQLEKLWSVVEKSVAQDGEYEVARWVVEPR